jgi:hypothetical protein
MHSAETAQSPPVRSLALARSQLCPAPGPAPYALPPTTLHLPDNADATLACSTIKSERIQNAQKKFPGPGRFHRPLRTIVFAKPTLLLKAASPRRRLGGHLAFLTREKES